MRILIATTMALLAAGAAKAEVIDFEGLADGAYASVAVGDYQVIGTGQLRIRSDSGSKAVFAPNPFVPPFAGLATLSRADGGAFDLLSLDVFAGDNNGLGVPIRFSAVRADGSLFSRSFQLPEFGRAPIPQTRVALDFGTDYLGIRSVVWSQGAEFNQIDNIAVRSAAAVPEPATWAMLVAGFGLVGASLRRRPRVAA